MLNFHTKMCLSLALYVCLSCTASAFTRVTPCTIPGISIRAEIPEDGSGYTRFYLDNNSGRNMRFYIDGIWNGRLLTMMSVRISSGSAALNYETAFLTHLAEIQGKWSAIAGNMSGTGTGVVSGNVNLLTTANIPILTGGLYEYDGQSPPTGTCTFEVLDLRSPLGITRQMRQNVSVSTPQLVRSGMIPPLVKWGVLLVETGYAPGYDFPDSMTGAGITATASLDGGADTNLVISGTVDKSFIALPDTNVPPGFHTLRVLIRTTVP